MALRRLILTVLILMFVSSFVGLCTILLAQSKIPPVNPPSIPPAAKANSGTADSGLEAAIKKLTEQYQKAFNAHDARTAAALCTENCEFTGVDGTVIRGRADLASSLDDEFKIYPRATIEVNVQSVRSLGKNIVQSEGTIKFKTPGNDVSESRYSAIHVQEEGQWLTASAREWVADPDTEATSNFLNFLVGEWKAKGSRGDVSMTYTWDENRAFLHGKYTITREGKVITSGTQVIGRSDGGLRSWSFETSGALSNSIWEREGNRWVDETSGTLADGTSVDSVNIIIPINADTFIWQTVERSVNGVPVSPLPPIKVTRVKPVK